MSKLLKLKRWLTIEDAAKRLSISIGEEVTEADVFRLYLDSHLLISVYFAKQVWARNALFRAEYDGVDKTAVLLGKYSDVPERICGVFDVVMTEKARILIESKYRYLKGFHGIVGDVLPASSYESIMLYDARMDILFEMIDMSPKVRFCKSTENDKIGPDNIHKSLRIRSSKDDWDEIAKEVSEEIRKNIDELGPVIENKFASFYRSWKLPEFSMFVIRTEELIRFEKKLISDETNEKPLHTSERRSTGQIIAALASLAGLDLSTPYKADETLRETAAKHGLEFPKSQETVVKFLKDATARIGKA